MTLVFVYGTLKRGGVNHGFLAGQQFMGIARTQAGYQLYDLEGFPGMVPDSADHDGVTGEVWAVDAATLAALDELEGLREGLYRREPIALQPPFADHVVESYIYVRSIAGRRSLGSTWEH
jgi:gamma-glutamylaminecyclotransferase